MFQEIFLCFVTSNTMCKLFKHLGGSPFYNFLQ